MHAQVAWPDSSTLMAVVPTASNPALTSSSMPAPGAPPPYEELIADVAAGLAPVAQLMQGAPWGLAMDAWLNTHRIWNV